VISLMARGELGAWAVLASGFALVGLAVSGFHVVLKFPSVVHISSNTISIYLSSLISYLSVYLVSVSSSGCKTSMGGSNPE